MHILESVQELSHGLRGVQKRPASAQKNITARCGIAIAAVVWVKLLRVFLMHVGLFVSEGKLAPLKVLWLSKPCQRQNRQGLYGLTFCLMFANCIDWLCSERPVG